MATSYTPLLGLALPVQGELSGTWGTTVNDNITSYLDAAVAGTQTLSTDADVTLTKTTGTALGSTSSQYAVINCTGSRAAQRTITAPATSKMYVVINATTGGQSVKLVGSGPTTGVTVANGTTAFVVWNGADFAVVATATSAGLVPVANGGTGASTSAGAPFALKGANSDITSLSGLTTALSVGQGGTGATTSAGAPFALKGANTDITSLGTVTTTTQSAGDNSTKLATTAYVDAAAASKPLMGSITAAANTPAANGMRFTVNAQSIDFRNATITTGGVVTRTVAAAINADVVSTATLGTASGVSERIAVLAIDNAGTVEVAVVNARGTTILDETQLISTTALSASATSANVIYSTTARTNVPFRVMGFVDSTQTVAGTWSAAPTQIQGAGGEAKMPRGGRLINVQKFTANGTYTRSTGATWAIVKCQGGGGAGGGTANVTAAAGGPGSGGVFAQVLVTALPATASVTVGAGGTGVSGGNGNAGGSTSVGSLLTAAGGAGGLAGIDTPSYYKSYNGGGNGGAQGATATLTTPIAGNSAAANTGAGGSGSVGAGDASSPPQTGGNGGSGWALVEEYA